MTVLLVALGAAVGAPLRYFIDRLVQSRHDSVFPWGTLIVNVTGSALFGVLAGVGTAAAMPPWLLAAGGVGFCGALTTYSTFGYETARLVEDGSVRYGCLNAVLSLVAGLGAAFLGFTGASSVWP